MKIGGGKELHGKRLKDLYVSFTKRVLGKESGSVRKGGIKSQKEKTCKSPARSL